MEAKDTTLISLSIEQSKLEENQIFIEDDNTHNPIHSTRKIIVLTFFNFIISICLSFLLTRIQFIEILFPDFYSVATLYIYMILFIATIPYLGLYLSKRILRLLFYTNI